MRKGRQMLFDLQNGDRFRAEGTTYEVISDFETIGIPYGFKTIGNSRDIAREGVVCAVDLNNKTKIRKFDQNAYVYAY